jgi:D-alanyl-D-alanine carboxypeptidase
VGRLIGNRLSLSLDRAFALALALALGLAVAAAPVSEAFAKKRSRAPSIAAAIVVDMNANRVLHAQNADTPRHPASLTKIMTLYMLFSYMRSGAIGPNSELVVTPFAASQSPTKLSVKSGQTIRVADAVNALVTLSANDVAVAVAENIAGTESNFAQRMTQKARELGMKNTTFRNASGLPNSEQVTTARDMAILAHHVIHDFPEYYSCFKTKTFSYRGRTYRNHNRLLFDYRGTDGIKTGYTRAAGFNLTASVKRDKKHLVAVVLGGRTGAERNTAMRNLLDANFPKASTTPPLVASRDAPAPATAPKRSLFALASAAVEPLSLGKPPGQAPAKPAGETAPLPPLAAPAANAVQPTGNTTGAGPFHVQVGAYTNAGEAEKRLGVVQQRAASLLEGYAPVTTTFQKDATQWYRARFAGFSRQGAQSTCDELKRLALDCVVMRAN